MLQEFKEFINRGNVVEIAVGLILSAAFLPIIDAFVEGVLMQIVALIFGQPNFDSLSIDISDTSIFYGRVITATITFLFTAAAVFLVVKAYNALRGELEEDGPDEVELLTEIRDALRARS